MVTYLNLVTFADRVAYQWPESSDYQLFLQADADAGATMHMSSSLVDSFGLLIYCWLKDPYAALQLTLQTSFNLFQQSLTHKLHITAKYTRQTLSLI